MNIFTVSLFGHREIDDLWSLDSILSKMIKDLIQTHPYVSFLIGRNGEFDEYAASVIKRIRKETKLENNDITLILPYSVTKTEYYEKYYDNIVIPECLYHTHPKSAITKKNKWMIDQSDLVIVSVKKEGGAYRAMKYTEKQNKKLINLYEVVQSE